MNRNVWRYGALGCGLIGLLVVVVLTVVFLILPIRLVWVEKSASGVSDTAGEQTNVQSAGDARQASDRVAQNAVPTLTPPIETLIQSVPIAASKAQQENAQQDLESSATLLTERYIEVNPGVVNIGVLADLGNGQQGAGAGSGFVLDRDGHIVTNNHVVDQATEVIVIFFNGLQAQAEIIGTDDDSDLAILKVEELPEDVHPLTVADSETVRVGDWAIAIGNPFGLGSSMTLGIVSAIGRSIPSGATPFAIPQAIQTDAAINPGNSGGPLLNLAGQVIGVNAQIRTSGAGSNSGVGFAIPANVVRHIAPVLIVNGAYDWPWLGVEGTAVGLTLMEINNLETQQGAYIIDLVPGGPADVAGLRGAEIVERDGFRVPMGGDIVLAIDGEPVVDFEDLSSKIAFKAIGDETVLTVLRDGEEQAIPVLLEARPSEFEQ